MQGERRLTEAAYSKNHFSVVVSRCALQTIQELAERSPVRLAANGEGVVVAAGKFD